ncbi:4-phosphoerythronate dehydrogenase [Glaciecola petra]|uniref:Erythronate-4-phosphate dehydrogenase n=1 Tax=Glaciecola petra TaxID=3075602 RepID=A0ABU2ZNI6_9ALTE|nr:4-phosphoerythronate dehydrogenase [Aestuariibacter sp. P117]MDT0593960.1 4-phosphoerythronate dehydrogenase [Aestuariibacter sp. P117]
MKILIDKAMPYYLDYFSELGEVAAFAEGHLLEQDLSQVEVLLVRSTTKIDNTVLTHMPKLKFVGTATAGYDHFDIKAIEAAGVYWCSAAGCNAIAVTQYAVLAVLTIACEQGFLLADKKIAIVGHGNVGRRVKEAMSVLGANVVIYDPPQVDKLTARAIENSLSDTNYVNFDEVLSADIICIHAPLNSDPAYPSQHLFNTRTLAQLNSNQILINAGRGGVVDNTALLTRLTLPNAPSIVLDVWENEPFIKRDLIPLVRFATAHIAGHSLEGKAKGTHILYERLCEYIQTPAKISVESLLPAFTCDIPPSLQAQLNKQTLRSDIDYQTAILALCKLVYNIENDDSVFRQHMSQSDSFKVIRQDYPIRREFSALAIEASNKYTQECLRGLGFIISNDSEYFN